MILLKEIELNKCVVSLYNNRIVKIRFKNGVDFLLEDAIEANRTMVAIADGKPFLSLVDSLNVRSQISNDAMRHFANDKSTKGIRIAEAIVIDSLHNRILANFYIKFVQPHNPIQTFKNTKSAIKWLEKIDLKPNISD